MTLSVLSFFLSFLFPSTKAKRKLKNNRKSLFFLCFLFAFVSILSFSFFFSSILSVICYTYSYRWLTIEFFFLPFWAPFFLIFYFLNYFFSSLFCLYIFTTSAHWAGVLSLQWPKLLSVIGHDQPDFQIDRTIFSWNLRQWTITEWNYLDSEVWQASCVWYGRENEKEKVC